MFASVRRYKLDPASVDEVKSRVEEVLCLPKTRAH